MITKDRTENVGLLNKRITLQFASTSSDGMGGTTVDSWTDIDEMWADIRPVSGQETFGQDALQGQVTHEITLRYRDDLDELGYTYDDVDNEIRLVYKNRIFNVRSAINKGEEGRYMQVMAKEEVGDTDA